MQANRTQDGRTEPTTAPTEPLRITTRLYTGAYIARAKGSRLTASCTEGPLRAAERLAEKLGHNPDLLELVEQQGSDCIYALPAAADICR